MDEANIQRSKRAKTEDEKEQRRIERVLRNRQAAQSSRERKRQEVEKLEGEKHAIERQNWLLKQRLMQVEHDKYRLAQQVAKMSAILAKTQCASKDLSPPLSPQLSSDLLQHDKAIKQELEEYPFSLPSPQDTLDPRSSFSSQSPSSSRSTSPIDVDFIGVSSSSDLTQHPAAMLCVDLQCQSEAAWGPPAATRPLDEAHSHRTRILFTLMRLHLCLTLASTVSSAILAPLSQLFTSLKTGSPLKTVTMTPMLFHLIHWLISTPVNPLTNSTRPTHSSTSTTMTSMPKTTSTSSLRPRPLLSTFRISLLLRLLACSPALARPLKDATGRELQMKTSYALGGSSKATSTDEKTGPEGIEGSADYGTVASPKDCETQSVQNQHQHFLLALMMAIRMIEKQQKEKQLSRSRSKRKASRSRSRTSQPA